jgi:hypothetical protein
VIDPDDSHADASEETLEQTARNQNSNLQRLIDAVGVLITASRDLMTRLHTGAGPPGDGSNDRPEGDDKGGA